jgi:hypothetical protein
MILNGCVAFFLARTSEKATRTEDSITDSFLSN